MLVQHEKRFEHKLAKAKKDQQTRSSIALPHCSENRLVSDPVVEVREAGDGIVFHSVSHQFELIDFIFKFEMVFYAVQVTVSQKHDADPEKIAKLIETLRLKRGESLSLIYAVPLDHFEKFVTAPADPNRGKKQPVTVSVIGIPNPALSTKGAAAADSGEAKRSKLED
jgi:hypothetical protein